MNVLVTGAGGFVGRALIPVLLTAGHRVVATSRDLGADIPGATVKASFELDPHTDWGPALDGIDTVIHLAARVHVMAETAADPLAENRRINTAGTRKLAEDSAAAGVKRLVFLSTVKVMGEESPAAALNEQDHPRPRDPYAIAKLEAEQALADISAKTGMEVVILRPPLVYGPGVQGNFAALLALCAKGWPLPLASVDNRRSLIFVGNLADVICGVVENPVAAGKTYHACDGAAVSSATLIGEISASLDRAGVPGRRPGLWPVPPPVLRLLAACVGKSAVASRLLDDFRIDDGLLRRDLGWTPPFSMVQGLKETAAWYADHQKNRT